tara:strand:- start:5082 stop:6104 length:1023 start_codon:yes stop_codon:yes gene_type:complete
MIKKRTKSLVLFLSFLALDLWANAFHWVKSGETLSDIARKEYPGSVYGPKGSLRKIIALNPKVGNPNRIYPNQKIYLSHEHQQRTLSSFTENNTAKENSSAVTTVEAKPSEKDKPQCPLLPVELTRSGIGIKLGTQFFRIDASDSRNGENSTLLSEVSPTMDLYWKLDVTEKWTTRFGLSSVSYKIMQTDISSSKTLSNNSGSLNTFDFGLTYKWTPESHTEISLGAKEKIFLRATSATNITIDKIVTQFVGLDHSQNFYRSALILVGSHLQIASDMPADGIGYKTKSGTTAQLGLLLSHETKSAIVQGELYYNYASQNSNIVEQKIPTIGTKLGLEWRF